MSGTSALEKLRTRLEQEKQIERDLERIERQLEIKRAQHIRRNNARLKITYIAMTFVYLVVIFLFFHLIG